VVNQVRPRDLNDRDLAALRAGKVTKKRVSTELVIAGLSGIPQLVTGLLTQGRDHAERRALEDSQHAVVERLEVPTFELPLLVDGIDLGALYELAGLLRDQGMA
jgi:hypothetical protein